MNHLGIAQAPPQPLAGHVDELAGLTRAQKLNHIRQHGDFQGLTIEQMPPHVRNPINTRMLQASTIREQLQNHPHLSEEAFNAGIHEALEHLNTAAGMIAYHHQQAALVPPHQVDEEDAVSDVSSNHSGSTGSNSLGGIDSDFSGVTDTSHDSHQEAVNAAHALLDDAFNPNDLA